jgi:pilus assembly protein CpaE
MQLRACLQETGVIGSVLEWNLKSQPEGSWERAMAADVVLLTLNGNPGLELAFAAKLRQANPNVRIIAYSPEQQPDSELLMHAMRSGVQEILPSPLSAAAVKEALTRFDADAETGAKKVPSKLILVTGSKGGVGTSMVAVNLAVQLTQITQQSVVLLDFARPTGHVGLMLDLQPRFSLRDATENLERLDAHHFRGLLTQHKTGLQVLGGVTQLEGWDQISMLALPGVVNVAQKTFDYVVMDYGNTHALDWISASVLRLARSILLVAETTVPALWALERRLTSLTSIGIDSGQTHILINRCRREDEETLQNLEKKLDRPIFARLPADFRQVSDAANIGIPLNRNHNNPLVSEFRKLAAHLAGIPPPAPPKEDTLGGLLSLAKRVPGIRFWPPYKEPEILAP